MHKKLIDGSLVKISPDNFLKKFVSHDKNYIAVLTDYFDDNDIEHVFPEEIRKTFGINQLKFLRCDY